MLQIVRFLSRNGIKTSQRSKETFFETLLRDQQIIVDLLTRFRLYNTSLLLEQRTMVRAMRDRANKLVNCDAANIRKSLEAAQKQIQLSKTIKESGVYGDLPSVLREMIDIRLEYPSATLTELGQYLEKPVSKSTVKYRWKKLQLIADQVLSGYSRLNQDL
jgi:DNA-binding protein WhiA